jgi:hypothetical protein
MASVRPSILHALRHAAVYSIFAAVGTLLSWSLTGSLRWRELGAAIAFYCGAAAFIGLTVGLTKGWATSRTKAALLGFMIAIPVAWLLGMLFVPGLPTRVMIVGTLANALIFGVFYGRLLWRPPA